MEFRFTYQDSKMDLGRRRSRSVGNLPWAEDTAAPSQGPDYGFASQPLQSQPNHRATTQGFLAASGPDYGSGQFEHFAGAYQPAVPDFLVASMHQDHGFRRGQDQGTGGVDTQKLRELESLQLELEEAPKPPTSPSCLRPRRRYQQLNFIDLSSGKPPQKAKRSSPGTARRSPPAPGGPSHPFGRKQAVERSRSNSMPCVGDGDLGGCQNYSDNISGYIKSLADSISKDQALTAQARDPQPIATAARRVCATVGVQRHVPAHPGYTPPAEAQADRQTLEFLQQAESKMMEVNQHMAASKHDRLRRAHSRLGTFPDSPLSACSGARQPQPLTPSTSQLPGELGMLSIEEGSPFATPMLASARPDNQTYRHHTDTHSHLLADMYPASSSMGMDRMDTDLSTEGPVRPAYPTTDAMVPWEVFGTHAMAAGYQAEPRQAVTMTGKPSLHRTQKTLSAIVRELTQDEAFVPPAPSPPSPAMGQEPIIVLLGNPVAHSAELLALLSQSMDW